MTGSEASRAILMGEEEEEGDRVARDIGENGADAGGGTKTFPEAPGRGCGIAPMRRLLVGVERCRNSVPVSAERISGARVRMVQESAWAYEELKCEIK